uniref:Uncharacterized protein n=1 Tax=Chromera velia CCMP2878 TaxID=1169474 RepID=A0A0G4I4B7_9ALVE|eukprot:Cvel_10811.t1-p1 / transcript=Cvel_10811.t1 / gene=Cvel_10811 / organism=Chromera_velia_CCMP2878 / gene_product=hypothetical protein / transcript_product=hypothetical protein / location=Cvel_scaffold661:40167-41014(+) / protein_length=136 / sequence_SO=supercontig / SO=protein_coding / is_pseudo=false
MEFAPVISGWSNRVKGEVEETFLSRIVFPLSVYLQNLEANELAVAVQNCFRRKREKEESGEGQMTALTAHLGTGATAEKAKTTLQFQLEYRAAVELARAAYPDAFKLVRGEAAVIAGSPHRPRDAFALSNYFRTPR